jgi:hypothetical protein
MKQKYWMQEDLSRVALNTPAHGFTGTGSFLKNKRNNIISGQVSGNTSIDFLEYLP